MTDQKRPYKLVSKRFATSSCGRSLHLGTCSNISLGGPVLVTALQKRETVLAAIMIGAAVVVLAAAPEALIGLAILPALGALIFFFWGTFRQSEAALFTLIILLAFLSDATFRIRDYADKGLDFQTLIKIALWGMLAAIALLRAQRWFPYALLPSNLPWMAFIIWLLFSATLSPTPFYSIAAAFSVLAYLLFSAFTLLTFEREDVFAAMVVALCAFCLVSIAVYFAVPEFGRFVYWYNEQLYVSGRMAGIAGSANNMGRLAAFGLILAALCPDRLRQLHRFLLPGAVTILTLALLMTNSRSSMVIALVLCTAIVLFRWHRAHFLVLLIAGSALAAALLLPASEELLKSVSRSGSLEEITSMTGRSNIWYVIPRLIEGRSWTGFGYASSVFVLPQHQQEIGFTASHAHNIFLQLLLTTGWIGVGLFTGCILCAGVRAAYFGDRTILVLIAFVLFSGITESGAFTSIANTATLAFACAVTIPPRAIREISFQAALASEAR